VLYALVKARSETVKGMAIVRWAKTLRRAGSPRRSYQAWLIPIEIREAYGIRDQDRVEVTIHTSPIALKRAFRISSGGELQVRNDEAQMIKAYSRNHETLVFSFETFVVADDNPDPDEGPEQIARETTRLALVAARRGQGPFRKKLETKYHSRCAVTNLDRREPLRASHIKPWSECNDREKLDVNNGLLLVANLDAAFDSKLVSFSDDGCMIGEEENIITVLKSIGSKRRVLKLCLIPTLDQRRYLQYHRKLCRLDG
jgi:bifunctional DNA-binding transcriptional regulator/antitoxin component of YhaV-PrlF toxin-antitoxin module